MIGAQWAATDPYAAAGLFEGVTVSPLLGYSVPCVAIGAQPLEELPESEQDDVLDVEALLGV